ncbi:pullulanase, type I [Lachnospiraceae bacterium A4]|nr:pullulanase, type I [Lachnospiraceae bacterium A4]
MEKAKTFCRKKRNLAKSMLSLMLVFAMVISNVQITPDAFSTVWAAENETLETSEASENSSQPSEAAGDSEEAGEASENSGDDKDTGTEETGKPTQESEAGSSLREEDFAQSEAVTETEASKQTDEEDSTKETTTTNASTENSEDSDSVDSSTQSVVEETSEDANDSTAQETETITETTESMTTEEATETETAEDENISADEAVGEAVDVVVHFKNTLNWNAVRLHSWIRNNGKDTNFFEENAGKLLEEREGYYSYTFENIILEDSFEFIGFLINASKEDIWAANNFQTTNITISKSELSNTENGKYECWVWLIDGNRDGENKTIPQVSKLGLDGPEISSDGTQVTFRYQNADASQVTIKGVKGDVWNNDTEVIEQVMDKDSNTGIFTSTVNLPKEGFSYKFVVKYEGNDNENWIFDPSNQNIVNGNSYVRKAAEKAVIRFHFKNALNWETISMHYWGMGIDGSDWPGAPLDLSDSNKDEKEFYTFDVNADGLIHDLGFIVTDGKADGGLQTTDNTISRSSIPDNDTYELWIWLDENKKDEGKYIPCISTSPISSPEFGETTENGTEVTFRYQQESGSAAKVLLAGTMTDWLEEPVEMSKDENDIWSCTMTLPHGEYEYKYVIPKEGETDPGTDGSKYNWEFDPFNTNYSTHKENDQVIKDNSLVYVAGEEYTYTVHYYNPANKASTADESDLYIWEPGITYTDTAKVWKYESIETDTNGIPWQTVSFKVPYKAMGIIGRPTAGSWTGQDTNQYYQLKQIRNGNVVENKTAEFWYIHGQGIYATAPELGGVTNLSASFDGNASMDYTQNKVLHIDATDSENNKVFVKEAYVNASGLGISEKLFIDPELMEVTLSVTEDTPYGDVELPITVVDYQGNTIKTSVTVKVVAKTESENDFDWDEAVIYFMVTDRFKDGDASNNEKAGADTFNKNNPGLYHGGDFAGVKEHLNDLKNLGVNTIWITPIVKNIPKVQVDDGTGPIPNYASYHGYWASDFSDINGALGTREEFQDLINAVHAENMKLMVDVVVNHAGYGAEESETFSGMLREAAIEDDAFHGGGGQAGLPDFMTENPEVRDMIIGWQLEWAEMGVDYFRVDTVKHVDNTTWMAFKNALTKADPDFKMIGEYYGASYNSENGGTLGSGEMDSLLDFNFKYQAGNFVRGGISSVETELQKRNAALNNTYLLGQFLSSHDENGFKFNLKQGENKMSDAAADAAALVAATLQITAKGQPVIYYGEEIGLTGENNYPQQTNRYDYDWTINKETSATYQHYKNLLGIRQKYSEIFARGDRKVVTLSDSGKYDVISRSYNGETIYVGMNINPDQAVDNLEIQVNNEGITQYKDEYSGNTYSVKDGKITITIPKASEGGTVVLVPSGFNDTLVAPQISTIAKGKTTLLPSQLTHIAEDGTKSPVEVTYSINNSADGVSLDDTKTKLTVSETFEGTEIQLTATSESAGSVTFTVKAVEDKNEITVKIHYTRDDGNYDEWNVWAWPEGKGGAQYDFTSENDEMVTVAKFEGRSISRLGYRIRKGDWAENDPIEVDRYIDLSNILSGTIHYYVKSGVYDGTMVMEEDVLLGSKVISAKYNQSTKRIEVVLGGNDAVGNISELFAIKDYSNTEIPITNVTKRRDMYVLTIDKDLSAIDDLVKSYFVAFDGYDYKITMPVAYSSAEFENKYTYEGDDLGATWTKDKTTFKVWAPTADKVEVKLYKSGTEGLDDLIDTLDMEKSNNGVWVLEKDGDLNGTYYTYNVYVDGTEIEACDPYARTTGVNGNRAMVINLDATNPEGWAADRGPNADMSYTDSIIYELHVRDFSIKENSGISDEHKGKFLGLIESGTTNGNGQPTGLDYLTDLGVTHIHLLPSYDYTTVDETKLDTPQFNWGYDPKNYNVPEGSYSTDPYNGEVRVKEMKQMIKTLHDNNINVIMDVVYNHVYDADKFCFNQIVPKYFSRTNADGTYSNGSGCGNDTASERAMVKKYIVDSVNYWAEEYHIDGFRFDLVGLLDTKTINEVVETVHKRHPEAVFYGEGWALNTAVSKDGYTMATQANASATPKFAYFSDTIRDLVKGKNDEENLGFVSGLTGKEEDMANCFRSLTWWSKNPTQIVNYASCHDNYTLMDKLYATTERKGNASRAEVIKMNNLSAAIYMMAEGIPLIHAGEEILRIKRDEKDNIIHNSYNSPDSVNQIKWEDLDKPEYRAVRDYYKGLIDFRKNHAALRLDSADAVAANVKYHWVTNEVILFAINGKDSVPDEVSDGIVIIFNATKTDQDVNLYEYGIKEDETWNVCINEKEAGTKVLSQVTDGTVKVAPISAMVLVKGETVDANSVYEENKLQNTERQRKYLQDLISRCEKLVPDNYTEESWNVFQEALLSAKQVWESATATQEQLIDARENLTAAYDALEVIAGVVDTAKLDALIAECKEKVAGGQGEYTTESWTVFTEALSAAEAVRAEQEVTQEAINAAYDSLKAAYEGLKKPVANTDKLKELIKEYDNLKQGNYTDESWAVFVNALAAAKAAVAKPDATQAEIDKAEQDLRDAYSALKVPEGTVDKEKLKALVAIYKEIQNAGQGDYTDESWKAFSDELANAEALLEKSDATQAEIDEAYSKLETAYTNLTSTKNTEKLDELIAECSKLDKGDYTDESWNALQEALKAAKEIADKPNATQAEIDKAEQDLRDAYNALKVPEGTIDKGKLKALIAVCDEILNKGQGSYTAESWNAFTLALEEAKAILAKEDATQPEVDEARNKLDKAHNNLVSIEEEIKALKELIVTCEKYIKEDYTTESWRVFEDALQAAKEVAENPNAALEEIQRAADDLQNAVKALIKVKEGLWTAWAPDSGLTAPENGEGNYHAAYTGKAFKPEILVYDGKTLLKEKTDYTVSYKNNTNAGPATVTVKGKGNYSESTTAEFTIDPIDIATLEIEDLYAAVASNNTKQVALKPIVKFNGKTLKMGKDYTVAYADPNGGKAPGNPSMDYDVKIDAASVNFTGTKMIKMTLVDKDNAYLMSKASIGKIVTADRVYTGEVLKPQITVKYGKTTLVKDTDYTVLYDNEHIEAGETATITIRGNGTTYFGEKTTSFKITGTPLKAGQISLKDVPKTGLVYTGKPQEPEIDGIDKKNYEAVYQNNTNAGTATVVITGKNGYTGTVKKTFKITAYDIFANSDKKFKYNINGSIPFAKGGSKLTDDQTGARFTISDGVEITLQQGKDYTLSYKNNKKVGDNTASVTIKGKGNFKGTLKNIPFTIVAQDLSNLNITAADVLQKNAKKFNKVVPVVTDLDGKTLKNKTDFELDTATAYTDEAGNPISSTEPATGTAIKVTVTGKGNYQGTASAIFHIIDNNMSIAKASVQIEPQRYTGSEVTLSNDQIHVKLKINGTITELQNDNFQIVGYSKNIKKGTAKVTIRGIYPYGGTKTVNFKITARPMN